LKWSDTTMTRHGFEAVATREIPELNTRGTLWRHQRTGARLLSMENDDRNKCFGISFRTPPEDSTGLPHILEHSVLCGSRKYPLKDPFVQLLKGSLKTFLNACTYPDKTCYPVASQNLQDFYHLVDVYLDAVFHPALTPEILMQEGWHFDRDENGDWNYRGVVYNEMKGAYSSPDGRIYDCSQHAVFPDNAYAVDAGGDPATIPQLTYEAFTAFHARYYHPSNAWIYFWGDDEPDERLRLAAAYLDEFAPRAVDSTITLQTPFTAPRSCRHTYPVDPAEQETHKSFLTVNWLLPEVTDPRQRLDFSVLAHLLVGTPASPLRKALIDSGLGESLAGGGLETSLRQMMFSTGLREIRAEDAGIVETLILDTLRAVVRDGFEANLIQAALNSVEFALRENNTGSFPRGLAVMFRALKDWLYGDDPFTGMAFEERLADLKADYLRDPRHAEALVREHLLDNPHRVTVLLEPDPEQGVREEAEEKARLASAREGMDAPALQALEEAQARLKKWQEAPDSQEAILSLPRLQISDLAPMGEVFPLEQDEESGARLLSHDLFTQGIVYLDVGLNLQGLEPDDLPWVSLLARLIPDIGAGSDDFVALSNRIGRDTGGIGTHLMSSATQTPARPALYLHLRGKCLEPKLDRLLSILRDLLLEPRFHDRDRLLQVVLEEKADLESDLIPGGHRAVQERLMARFDLSGWAEEQMEGVSFLFFLRRLVPMIRDDWDAVLERLNSVRRRLVARSLLHVNVTTDGPALRRIDPALRSFIRDVPAGGAPTAAWHPEFLQGHEALLAPSTVNYVGKALRIYPQGTPWNGALYAVTHYLRTSWMWDQVRLLGGAYGASLSVDYLAGVLSMVSYRDPHIDRTLGIYDLTADYLRNLQIDSDELTRSVIGAVGAMDPCLLPDAKGFVSLARFLCGRTDAERQRLREEAMATRLSDFHALGDLLAAARDTARVAVLGHADAIDRSATLKTLGITRLPVL